MIPDPNWPRDAGTATERATLAEEAAERLGLMNKAKRYAAALARWARAGFPRRSDAEVDRLYAECCSPCEELDAERGICIRCGCCVARRGLAIRNKLAMATESCQLGKWAALEQPDSGEQPKQHESQDD